MARGREKAEAKKGLTIQRAQVRMKTLPLGVQPSGMPLCFWPLDEWSWHRSLTPRQFLANSFAWCPWPGICPQPVEHWAERPARSWVICHHHDVISRGSRPICWALTICWYYLRAVPHSLLTIVLKLVSLPPVYRWRIWGSERDKLRSPRPQQLWSCKARTDSQISLAPQPELNQPEVQSWLGTLVKRELTLFLHRLSCFFLCWNDRNKNDSSIVLPGMVTTGYMWLFKVKLVKIKYNLKLIFSARLATCQVLSNYTWLLFTGIWLLRL